MSNTVVNEDVGQGRVQGLGNRPRARRHRPRDDPADRLPRPLPRARRAAGTRRRRCSSPPGRSRQARPARSSPASRCTRRRRSRARTSRRARSTTRSTSTGRAAAIDIFPGQQLTAADFAASTSTTVDSQITGPERALSVSIDAVHGSLSQLKAGDDIDIYVGTSRRAAGGGERDHHALPSGGARARRARARRRQPRPEGPDQGRGRLRLRRRPHAALVRAPADRRREEDRRTTPRPSRPSCGNQR